MRKLRTHEHIIEDLGFNYIERQILKGGHIMHRYGHGDYGMDGEIITFNIKGEIDLMNIKFQLKSTDNIKLSKRGDVISFDLSKRDLEHWLLSSCTVLLLLYDALNETVFYVDLQAYFAKNQLQLHEIEKFVRVKIPINDTFTTTNFQSLLNNLKL